MNEEELVEVSQEMMGALTRAKLYCAPAELLYELTYDDGLNPDPVISPIKKWYKETRLGATTAQLTVIKHIYLNEPQFKSEKPKKWVVRSKEKLTNVYFYLTETEGFLTMELDALKNEAFRFNTKEEAEKWTNPQTEAVEAKDLLD